eukprot:gene19978-21936_t
MKNFSLSGLIISCLLVILVCVSHAIADQEQNKAANSQRKAPVHDSKHIHNKEHIKEHLQEFTDVKDQQLDDDNLQFHYFKVHDYDNNDMLDGIELANAMSHYHDEETGEQAEEYTEDELESMVDQILEEDDINNDGFIDYPEFIESQKREEANA